MGIERPRQGGRFLPKDGRPRPVRSLRLTDNCWEALGVAAAARGITRADLLEQMADDDAFDWDQTDNQADDADDYRAELLDELRDLEEDLLDDEDVTRGGKDKGVVRRVLRAILERLE